MDRRAFITSCAAGALAAGQLYSGPAAEAEKGLAVKYPNDRNIESDPDVLMVEGFERDDWRDKWQEISGNSRKYGLIEADPEKVLTGEHCLRLDFVPEAGKGAAGWMHHWWDGSEVAYMRYYFRLSAGGNWGNQKIMQLHGHPRGKRYGTGAGNRPTGYDWFCTGTGIGGKDGPPWNRVILYTYYPHQIGPYGDNVTPNQGWQPSVDEERWTCYEYMIKLNDVGNFNGEQRLWIDGRLAIEQTGMEWRKSEDMVINNVMQPTYTHTPPADGRRRSLWLDNLVVARCYIGPLNRI
ncbi:MAG: hypothetical protein FVQ81_02655 [Candidatus Glassbacteria bacterium]|nr:hypothetical protein [Candidatus Glassbacteria bacterium]